MPSKCRQLCPEHPYISVSVPRAPSHPSVFPLPAWMIGCGQLQPLHGLHTLTEYLGASLYATTSLKVRGGEVKVGARAPARNPAMQASGQGKGEGPAPLGGSVRMNGIEF